MVDGKEQINEDQVIDTSKYNKCVYLLLPMLGLNQSFYSKMLNCYIGDVINKCNVLNYHLFINLKYENDKIRDIPGFKEQYSTSNSFMYVIRVPNKFDEDYLKFILGKYSEFSEEYKQSIYKLLPKPITNSKIFKVLNKSEDLKKIIEDKIGQSIGNQEVLSIPNMNNEIYG